MIRKTLPETKKATFLVTIPDVSRKGFPAPNGTGFFITASGYFLTANHVVKSMSIGDKTYIERPTEGFSEGVADVKLVDRWEDFDIALMKANLQANQKREWLKNLTGFPFIEVELDDQEEGAPVYSFGYPLSKWEVRQPSEGLHIGLANLSTRTTSAIIASTREYHGPVRTNTDPKFYVIDKALNYGNSGGPIILQETGKVFALCTRFQPLAIKQEHLGDKIAILVPSLYGVVSSLQNIAKKIKSLK